MDDAGGDKWKPRLADDRVTAPNPDAECCRGRKPVIFLAQHLRYVW